MIPFWTWVVIVRPLPLTRDEAGLRLKLPAAVIPVIGVTVAEVAMYPLDEAVTVYGFPPTRPLKA